jgi:DNA-binding GntR family transcriptional regulator
MPTTALPSLKSGSLRTQVLETLRDAIFAGKLRPGDPIREVHVGSELGVSQNTVREALLELQQMGLVVRSPNRNTTVTKLSDDDIRERVTVRLLLEPHCVQTAARKMTPEDFDKLRRLVRQMEVGKGSEAAHLDLEFHRVIWNCSGNRVLAETLEQLVLPLFAFVTIVRFRNVPNLKALAQRHDSLINILQSGDQERIGEAIRDHLTAYYQHPQSFPESE